MRMTGATALIVMAEVFGMLLWSTLGDRGCLSANVLRLGYCALIVVEVIVLEMATGEKYARLGRAIRKCLAFFVKKTQRG